MPRSREPSESWCRDCGLAVRVNASEVSRRIGDPWRYRAHRYMAGIEKPGPALLVRLARAVGATPGAVEYACRRARERRKAKLAALAVAREAARR